MLPKTKLRKSQCEKNINTKIMFDDNFSHCSKLLTLGGCMREESIKERFLKKEKKVYKKLSDPLLFCHISVFYIPM